MPKFYEIKVFTIIGYIALIIFSLVGYFAGTLSVMGLAIIPIPLIILLVITILYIKYSVENKKFHFLCLSLIIFFISIFIGNRVDNYRINNIKNYLLNAVNIIEEYKINNNIIYLNDSDLNNISLPDNIKIELNGLNYTLEYKNGKYSSEIGNVLFKPRP